MMMETRAGAYATLTTTRWDGVVERTTPGQVWVLRHRLTNSRMTPDRLGTEELIKGVFWSKEAGFAYVEREYGYPASTWHNGDPSEQCDFMVVDHVDGSELILQLELCDLDP